MRYANQRPWTAALFGLLAALLGPAGSARSAFVVSPMECHLQVPAGSGETAVLFVHNSSGQRPLGIKLYLSDSIFGPDGQEEDRPPGTLERSCASWILLEESVLDLAPGEMRQVRVRIVVPGGAQGSFWTKLYLEEIDPPEATHRQVEGRSYQIFLKQRMGVRLFEDVTGTLQPEADVREVAVREAENERTITTRVGNPGGTLVRCQGRTEIRDSRGQVVELLPLGSNGEFLLFPSGERNLSVQSRVLLSAGTYTALSIVDYGGDHLVAGEEVFRIDGEGLLTRRESEER